MKVSRSESLGSRSGGGRPASVVLLDDRRLELTIHPRLLGGELLDLVSSHVGLKEKEYFGLALLDEKGLTTWLSLDRKVLEQDLPRKPSVLTLHFLVKFFIESISHLAEVKTVELFYLQARSLVSRGALEAEAELVFQLGALALQGSHGDFVDEASALAILKRSPLLLPQGILKDDRTEERVTEHYRKTRGQTRGQALVNYMSIVESMPTYGVHYFEVFDKRQKPWWLGLSCRGIAQYAYEDRKVPVRVFQWKRLENLYFRDKKFSIEVHDLKRVIQAPSTDLYEDSLKLEESSLGDAELLDAIQDASTRVSSSRRSFHPGSIRVYVWFGKTQGLTKCIWQSAISQHQFYLDRKRAKLRHHAPPRSLNDIARDLTRSTASLSSGSSLSNLSRQSSISNQSLLGAVGGGRKEEDEEDSLGETVSEETRRARMEMLTALRARREALDSKLREKTKLLKELCLKEGELTGDLPPETPLSPGETLPIIRRRIGTEFELNFERLLLNNSSGSSPQAELLANLELEREIQMQITNAALKISNDTSVSKSVRKQRKISYQQSQRKLKEIESKLSELRQQMSISYVKKSSEEELRRRLSVPDLERCPSHSSLEEDTDQVDHTQRAPLSPRSCPTSPRKNPGPGRSSDSTSIDSSSQRFIRTGGYVPNSVYLRSSYRVKQYPTLTSSVGQHSSESPPGYQRPPFSSSSSSSRLHPHHHMPVPTPEMVLGSSRSATLPSPYRNKFELNSHCDSPVGLYNCPQQRTSQAFSSLDDIDALQQLQQSSPGARRLEAAAGNYPSLERSARKKLSRRVAETPVPPRPPHPHPPPTPPPKDIRRSLEDLSALEAAGVHGRSKMRYEEIRSNDEYPRWNSTSSSSPRDAATYPLPLPVNRTTLLPGQTYPDTGPSREQLLHIGLLNNNSNSIQDPVLKKEENQPSSSALEDEEETPPPPLYPKQYYARRRSGLLDRPSESPAVNRKVKPPHLSSPSNSSSFDTSVIPGEHHHHIRGGGSKYVPYKETTKPFEMSDFYKYSTKFRNVSASSLKSGDDSSDRSSTTSAGSNQPPPEIPARSNLVVHHPPLPSSPLVQTATVTPTKSKLSAQNSDSSLGDAFSSEMLAWYNNQKANNSTKSTGTPASSSSSSGSGPPANKSATLV